MPEPFLTSYDVSEALRQLKAAGYSGEELTTNAAKALRELQENRRSKEFLEKSTLGQAWWAAKRGYKGVGEIFSSLPAMGIASLRGKPEEARTPGEIYRGATQRPFQAVPTATTPEMPKGFRIASQLTGTLARDLPLLHGMFAGLGAIPLGPKAAISPVTQVAKTAGAFEALGQIGGEPTGRGAATGVALSALPAAMGRLRQFRPGGLPIGLQATGLGAGGVTGLSIRDLFRGMSIPEQFDVRSPEGQASVLQKALAFGFISTGAARHMRRYRRMTDEANKALIEEGQRIFEQKVKPETEAFRKAALAVKNMTPDELGKTFAKSNDVILKNLAKQLKVEMPKNSLTTEESAFRASGRPLSHLDTAKPNRTIFTEQGRTKLIDQVYKKFPDNLPGLASSLQRERQAAAILYNAIRNDAQQYKTEPMAIRPPAGLRRFTGTPYEVTKEQRAISAQLHRTFANDVKQFFPRVNPQKATAAWRLMTTRRASGYQRGTEIYNQVAKTKPKTGYDLHDYYAKQEYGNWQRISKGVAAEMFRHMEVQTARQTGVARDVGSVLAGRWEVPMPEEARAKTPADRHILDTAITHYARRAGARFTRWQDRHPEDAVGTLHYHLSHAHTEARQFAWDARAVQNYVWGKDLPPQARTQTWKPFRQYMWQLANPKSAKAMKLPSRTAPEVAKLIGWKGTPQALESQAKATWSRFHTFADWLFARSGMSLNQYRDTYLPHMVNWYKSGAKEPLVDYFKRVGISRKEAQNFAQLLSQMTEPPSQKIIKEKMPWYEHPRKLEKKVAEWLVYEDDPVASLQKYTQLFARRTIKEPLLPLARDIIEQVRLNHAADPGGGTRLMKSMGWYLDAWWGRPTSLDRYLAGGHPVAKGFQWLRAKLPFASKDTPAITERTARPIGDFLDFMTTTGYGLTLAWKITPPLKNLTQSGHNIVVVGPTQWAKSLGKVFVNKKFRAEVNAMFPKVRYQYLDVPQKAVGKLHKGMMAATRAGLTPFRLADRANVTGAIASGLDLWSKASAGLRKPYTPAMKNQFLATLKLRRVPFGERIFGRFKRLPGIDKTYKSTWRGSKTFGDLLWTDVSQGNMTRPKTEYIKWLTYLTQWAYGAPEAPPMFRGSFNRLAFQYRSWALHYSEFLTGMAKTNMGREWLRLAMVWGTVAGAGSAIGMPLWRWIMAGPYPREYYVEDLVSPAAKMALLPPKLGLALAHGTQEWLAWNVGIDDIDVRGPAERVMVELEKTRREFAEPYLRQLRALTEGEPLMR